MRGGHVTSVASAPLTTLIELTEYTTAALNLLADGYYDGLIAAVNECFDTPSTFAVLDCPSGTGKTLAGVALRQLDCEKGNLGLDC